MPDIELRLPHHAWLRSSTNRPSAALAARLGYTQSTVSQHVAALERAVGGAVFDRPRGPKLVRLTPLGEVVLKHGRGLLADARRLTDSVDRFKAGAGRVDIGTLQSVSTVILPSVVQRCATSAPTATSGCSRRNPRSPAIGDLDLLFYDAQIGGEVEHRKLLDDPYLLVAKPGDFAAGTVRARGLDGAPLVAWPATCDQPRLEQTLADCGAQPHIVFRTASNETILAMVRAGLGSAVLPWLAVHGAGVWTDDRLRVHELHPSPAREIYLHWPAGRSRSPLAVRASELAVEVADELSARRDSTVTGRIPPAGFNAGWGAAVRSLGGLVMFARRFSVAIVAVLAALGWLLVAPTAAIAAPTTLYVAVDGSDSNACTTKVEPCHTIGHAIALAADTGTTIHVATGPVRRCDARQQERHRCRGKNQRPQ